MQAKVIVAGVRDFGWRHIYYESEKSERGPWYVGVCNSETLQVIVRPNVPNLSSAIMGDGQPLKSGLHWLIAVAQHVASFGSVERTITPQRWINVDESHFDEAIGKSMEHDVSMDGRWVVEFEVDESGNASLKEVKPEIADWPPMFGQ